MSVQVMTAVWERSMAYGGELLIMLAIANYADIHGRAYPSIPRLAQDGRMTERNAQYCIQKLEALGELKVQRNAGPHGTHIFQVLLKGEKFSGCKVFTHQKKRQRNKELTSDSTEITGENISGVQSFQTETHFTGGVKPISPEPSLDPSVLQKKEEDSAPAKVTSTKTRRLPKSQEPGELHPNTIEAVKTMMVDRFHCLAEPTKDNEIFWDAQIAYLQDANAISFTACLKKVDAYWASNRDKVAMKAPGLRKQMRRGIEIEVEKAQRNISGRSHYAN